MFFYACFQTFHAETFKLFGIPSDILSGIFKLYPQDAHKIRRFFPFTQHKPTTSPSLVVVSPLVQKTSKRRPKGIQQASNRRPKDIQKASKRLPKDVQKTSKRRPQKASKTHPKDIKKAFKRYPKGVQKISNRRPKGVQQASKRRPKD